jgi:hypothetical protein
MEGRTFEVAKGESDVAFTALVYAVTDNTIHALCLRRSNATNQRGDTAVCLRTEKFTALR